MIDSPRLRSAARGGRLTRALALVMLLQSLGFNDAARAGDGPIQDNSFLLEEAYNQESGVVQHISAWGRTRDTGGWAYSFTQEWPVGGVRHQFSWTFLWLQPEGIREAGDGVGDLALNYRYQLVGDGTAPVAMSPRLSLLLPTGDPGLGRSSGAWGAQANIPLSVVLGPRVVSHINLGGTYLRGAEDAFGNRGNLSLWNIGQSFIWLATPRVNAMLEFVYLSGEEITGSGASGRVESLLINPGIRWAHNFRNGLQIVPGVSLPIGAGPSSGTQALFLYLSFEHPFTQAARSATP